MLLKRKKKATENVDSVGKKIATPGSSEEIQNLAEIDGALGKISKPFTKPVPVKQSNTSIKVPKLVQHEKLPSVDLSEQEESKVIEERDSTSQNDTLDQLISVVLNRMESTPTEEVYATFFSNTGYSMKLPEENLRKSQIKKPPTGRTTKKSVPKKERLIAKSDAAQTFNKLVDSVMKYLETHSAEESWAHYMNESKLIDSVCPTPTLELCSQNTQILGLPQSSLEVCAEFTPHLRESGLPDEVDHHSKNGLTSGSNNLKKLHKKVAVSRKPDLLDDIGSSCSITTNASNANLKVGTLGKNEAKSKALSCVTLAKTIDCPPVTMESDECFDATEDTDSVSGIWVECVLCNKWRFLENVADPSELIESWHCGLQSKHAKSRIYPLQNPCEEPQATLDDDCIINGQRYIYTKFTAGSLVWAKLDGYPEWPAMIDCDAFGHFAKYNEKTGEVLRYMIVFLDPQGPTKQCIHVNRVRTFFPGCKISSNVNAKHRKRLELSIAQAEKAVPMSLKERIYTYGYPYQVDIKEKKTKNTRAKKEKQTIRKHRKVPVMDAKPDVIHEKVSADIEDPATGKNLDENASVSNENNRTNSSGEAVSESINGVSDGVCSPMVQSHDSPITDMCDVKDQSSEIDKIASIDSSDPPTPACVQRVDEFPFTNSDLHSNTMLPYEQPQSPPMELDGSDDEYDPKSIDKRLHYDNAVFLPEE